MKRRWCIECSFLPDKMSQIIKLGKGGVVVTGLLLLLLLAASSCCSSCVRGGSDNAKRRKEGRREGRKEGLGRRMDRVKWNRERQAATNLFFHLLFFLLILLLFFLLLLLLLLGRFIWGRSLPSQYVGILRREGSRLDLQMTGVKRVKRRKEIVVEYPLQRKVPFLDALSSVATWQSRSHTSRDNSAKFSELIERWKERNALLPSHFLLHSTKEGGFHQGSTRKKLQMSWECAYSENNTDLVKEKYSYLSTSSLTMGSGPEYNWTPFFPLT